MKVCEIEKDGLPDIDKLTGRVAFIWDGNLISGWPLFEVHIKHPGNNYPEYTKDVWEASDDNIGRGQYAGVEKYIIFDKPIWEL